MLEPRRKVLNHTAPLAQFSVDEVERRAVVLAHRKRPSVRNAVPDMDELVDIPPESTVPEALPLDSVEAVWERSVLVEVLNLRAVRVVHTTRRLRDQCTHLALRKGRKDVRQALLEKILDEGLEGSRE